MIADIVVVALIGFLLVLLAISPYMEYKERIEKIKENYTYAYGTCELPLTFRLVVLRTIL